MKRAGLIALGCIVVLSVLEPGCRSDNKHQHVDFSRRATVRNVAASPDSGKKTALSVVVSSIYSAQEIFSHYNDLFVHIGDQCSLPMKITYCKNSREAYRLFAEGLADVGLVGTGIFIIGKRNNLFKALVVPVIDGKATFQAYVIVHHPSPNQTFGDLKNRVFAFTDPFSLTGYFYPLSLSKEGTGFWKKTVFAGPHDYAIDLVQRGIVDGASVSSNVFDDVSRNYPEKTDHVRIIEKSDDFGIPPVVVRRSTPPQVEASLRAAFLKLKSESVGWELLQILGIDTFIVADDSLYASAVKFVPETVVP
jgi:phosphonate transport system substrate-binding protein